MVRIVFLLSNPDYHDGKHLLDRGLIIRQPGPKKSSRLAREEAGRENLKKSTRARSRAIDSGFKKG
jgi:hypothetical protein